MLAGLSFTDERRERKKDRKRDDDRLGKSHKRRRRDGEKRDESEAPARDAEERVREGARAKTTTNDEPHEAQSDFFSAALAAKPSSKGDDSRGREAARKAEEDRRREIVSSRELNPHMRGEAGDASPAPSVSTSVVGDGGSSWRLKALRRAQERAAAEGKNINEVVSEHWGSVNELVAGIGENAAHGKAHIHARKSRARFGRSADGTSGDGMRAPDSFGPRRRREGTGLREDDRAIIQSALTKSNKFASDGSFMDKFENGEMNVDDDDDARAPRPVTTCNDVQTLHAVPKARNSAQNVLSTNMSAAAALRARLFGGNSSKAPQALASAGSVSDEILPMVTADGRAAPGAFGRDTTIKGGVRVAEGQVRKAPRVTQRFEDGTRTRYFADDDKSLTDLVKEQKYGGTADIDVNVADNIARNKRYRGKELDVDDEYDHDGGLEMYESREKKMSGARQQARAKEKASQEWRRTQAVQHKCTYCIDAPDRPKHLHVAYGNMAYLMLPPQGRLVVGHCVIAPMNHVQSSRQTDEDVWEEMRNFKKCLVRMFAQEGKECCFIETAINLGLGGRHCVVECVPIPQELSEKARMYFRKELLECESEWSTHHAKTCLSTAPPKGLRGTIPANFAYVHVEFGMRGGYVHVIDDESKWNRNFCRNVLIGLLDLPEHLTDAKQRPLAPNVLRAELDAFLKMYDPVDWTKQLV